jgi:DNA-directed RNA polymerase specialized sigma24 family protein
VTSIHPSIYDIVPSVVATIHNRYHSFVEKDDLKQECLKWAITRSDYINEQLAEPDTKKRQHNEARVAYQMRRVAERYARREKAARSGYNITDEAYYESATLAQLLPFVIASVLDGTVLEQAQEMIRDGQPKGSSSPAEGGNLLAVLVDIKKCYMRLDVNSQQLLTLRYHENFTLAQIANVLGCAVSTAERRCMGALRRLQDELGGISPYK